MKFVHSFKLTVDFNTTYVNGYLPLGEYKKV